MTSINMRFKGFYFSLLILFSSFAYAVESPISMLKQTTDQIINELKVNRASIQRSHKAVYRIVNRILLPHVDMRGMSRSVLGRFYWKKASGAQQKRFTSEFTRLVVHTYSGALAQYTNERVIFFPIRGGYQGKRRVQVKSLVKRKGAPNIPISYRVILLGGNWKVYDMSVEGVSLLQSFRSQFRAELSRGTMEQLIQRVKRHNARFN